MLRDRPSTGGRAFPSISGILPTGSAQPSELPNSPVGAGTLEYPTSLVQPAKVGTVHPQTRVRFPLPFRVQAPEPVPVLASAMLTPAL